jgi:hypothetical protein
MAPAAAAAAIVRIDIPILLIAEGKQAARIIRDAPFPVKCRLCSG